MAANKLSLKLSGPGTAFDEVFLCIREALVARGYEVAVTNPYPPKVSSLAECDARRANTRAEIEKTFEARGVPCPVDLDPTYCINFQVEHRPWGG